MTEVEKVDWFCPKCNSYVSSESVTFEETHQICNTGVILEPLNQNNMTAVEWLQMKMATSQTEEMVENINLWFAKAKKIEKKIIAQAFEDGDYNYFYNHQNGREFLNGIEYYNEKFKSE